MITPLAIAKKTMTNEKKSWDKTMLFSCYVMRPLSYIFTVPLLYTKITPNMVTIISIIFAVVGLCLNSIFTTCIMLTVGWIMFFMWDLFDGIDGNIARYKKQFSKFGTAYDAMGGYACIVCMLFSSGIAAYHMPCVLDPYLPWDNVVLIICGAFACIFNIFPRLMLYFIKATVDNKEKISGADDVNNKLQYGLIKSVALNVMAPSDGMLLLLLPAIWLQALDVYTYFYFIMSFLGMMASLFVMFRFKKPQSSNNDTKASQEDALDNKE